MEQTEKLDQVTFAEVSNFAARLKKSMEQSAKIRGWDNKRLLWTAKILGIEDEMTIFSPLETVWGEIEKRLYPEYDGETITWEEWGWMTPEGEIRYTNNLETFL